MIQDSLNMSKLVIVLDTNKSIRLSLPRNKQFNSATFIEYNVLFIADSQNMPKVSMILKSNIKEKYQTGIFFYKSVPIRDIRAYTL